MPEVKSPKATKAINVAVAFTILHIYAICLMLNRFNTSELEKLRQPAIDVLFVKPYHFIRSRIHTASSPV
jgi:hypothetical protein